ncbi:MAG: AsmA-like C-terminal region-containing protein [Cytophagales bacterium]
MRKLKIIFGTSLLVFILSSAGIVTYFYFNQDKIIRAFVNEINNYLDVEAKVEHINLNIFEHWPFVAVELNNASIRGANCGISEPLLIVEKLSILANPIAIFKGDFNIRHIFLENGRIYIFRDQRCSNYDIFKKDSEGGDEINLERIILSNIFLDYESRIEHQNFKFYSEKATISGQIKENEIIADHSGKWKVLALKSDNIEFDSEELIELSHNFKMGLKSKFILISDLKSSLYGSNIEGEAVLDLLGNQSEISFASKEFQIDKLSAFLNQNAKKYINDYSIKGNFAFDITLNGNVSKNNWACDLNIKTQSIKLKLKNPEQGFRINELNANWTFSNLSNWKSSILNLQTIRGKNDNSDFTASLKIQDFNNPTIKAQLFTSQKVDLISKFLHLPIKNNAKGTIDIDLAYNGQLPNKKSGFPKNAELSGILTLNQVQFETIEPSVLIKDMNGQLVYDNGLLTIQSLLASTVNSHFKLDGTVSNSMDYFLKENSRMFIETSVTSDFINLEEWINDSDEKNEYILKLPDRIIHKHHLNIKKLNFKRFKAQNINGDLSIKNQTLHIDSVRMNVAGGQIMVNMDLDARNPKRIEWFTSGKLNSVFIDSVFYIFRDFNQEFIQQRHLEGQLTASFTGFMISDDHLNFDMDKHIFSINSKVSNGRLILFEPLQAVSKFIREDDLMNLKFDELENEIFIKNSLITLPKMSISSNVRTINVQGTHTFDNQINYDFEIPVTREKIDRDERFGQIKDDKSGKTKLLIKLIGTSTDYKVKYNEEALKENIKTGIKEEVKELKKILKNQKEEEEDLELDEDEYFDFN